MMYLKSAVLHQGIPTIEWLNKTDGCNNRYKNKIFSFLQKKRRFIESENSFFSEKNS